MFATLRFHHRGSNPVQHHQSVIGIFTYRPGMMNTDVSKAGTFTSQSHRRRHISPSLQPVLTANNAISARYGGNSLNSCADRGDHLVLKASWTKGGKERIIPIRTEQQREVINLVHRAKCGFLSLEY
jgi:hypothetical protein